MNHLGTAISSAFRQISRVVIPLYVGDSAGRPLLIGSGFFVDTGRSTLLVSAAHVLEAARSARLFYYVTPSKHRAVTGRLTRNKWAGSRETDLLDVAAVRLDEPELPPYPAADKWPIDLATWTLATAPTHTARYGLVGFPASRSRVRTHPAEVRVAPYGHLAESASPRDYASNGLRPGSHLFLVFNRKKSYALDGQGRSFPKPHGLSGSPVFELYDNEKTHSGEAFPLAGVVTTWRPPQHRLLCAGPDALGELISVAGA